MGRWLLGLAFLALAVGCGARTPHTSAPDRRAMVRLERQAQREMSCPAVRVTPIAAVAFQVDGCGQVREFAYVCTGRRCRFQPIVPATVRASADLGCAPELISGQADSATHRAFFGCSRGIAYRLLCVDHGCTWARTQEQVTIATPGASVAPISDPSLAAAVIPPPPGAAPEVTARGEVPAAIPPPPGAPPPSSVPPPPASTTLTPSSPDVETVVIPPPPS